MRMPGGEMTDYPLLPEPRTVRLRFCKTGPLQYISHLDLQRTFGRILARADLPLWYTQGFNPHPKLVFALPLPIGCESVCEAADVRIIRDMPCGVIAGRMSLASVADLRFTDCYIPSRKFDEIAWAVYRIDFASPSPVPVSPGQISEYLTSSPVMMTKKTKSGEKEIDIVPLIGSVNAELSGGFLSVEACLSASEGATLSPEMLVSALRTTFGFPGEDVEYRITRKIILDKEKKTFV